MPPTKLLKDITQLFKLRKQPVEFEKKQRQTSDFSQLFNASGPGLESVRDFKKRMMLRIDYEVAKVLLKDPSSRGVDYKIQLVPDGNQPTILYSESHLEDENGVKVDFGMHNGKEVFYAFFRRKEPDSKADKQTQIAGGKRAMPVEVHESDLQALIKFLERYKNDAKNVSIDQRAMLTRLHSFAENESVGQELLFKETCGGDAKKVERLETVFYAIKEKLIDLETEEDKFRSANAEAGRKIRVRCISGAATEWPLEFGQNSQLLARQLSSAVPMPRQNEKDELVKWCEEYTKEVLPRLFGVELLEYNSKDCISEMCSIFRLAQARIASKAPDRLQEFHESHRKFDEAFSAINGLVNEVDWLLKGLGELNSGKREDWLEPLCGLAERRKKIFEWIVSLDSAKNNFLEPAEALQVRIKLATMAANLCRIGKEEYGMWGIFLKGGKWAGVLTKANGGTALHKKILAFAEASESEYGRLCDLQKSEKTSRESHKLKLRKTEEEIEAKISEAIEISAPVGNWLKKVYSRTKDHINYKQGEQLSKTIKDSYFTSTLLLQALWGTKQGDSEKIRSSVANNAAALSALSPDVQALVMDDIKKMLFTKSRAFDLETNYGKIAKRGKRGEDLKVKYWFSVRTDDAGEKIDMLNLSFKNRTVQFDINGKLPYDPNYMPVNINVEGADPIQAIYGQRLALNDIVNGPAEGLSLGELYSKIHSFAYPSDPSSFERVKEKLAATDMESSHFLLTLSEPGFQSGCLTNLPGTDGRPAKAMPKLLSGKGSTPLNDAIQREYGNYESYWYEVEQYKSMKVARRVADYLSENIYYYVSLQAEFTMGGNGK